MMRKSKSLITMIAAMLFGVSTASATGYRFSFDSSDAELTAAGQITVDTAGEVTGVSGVISGLTNQTISGVAANPGFPNPSYSPDGSFIYNNLYYPTGMTFDINGLLFVTAENPGGYWNLWGNSAGNYSLWESVGSYNYPIEESGSLSLTATPEPSTWALMLFGFAGLGYVGYWRRVALARA
jgi:hypothetical protein